MTFSPELHAYFCKDISSVSHCALFCILGLNIIMTGLLPFTLPMFVRSIET